MCQKMYGLLFLSIEHFVNREYGGAIWKKILLHANLDEGTAFTTHAMYDNELMVKLAQGCSEVIQDKSPEGYMCYFGKCFFKFCSTYKYDQILMLSGRYFRDFLHEINNLHETIRFGYPKMMSPTFMVKSEDVNGCILCYISRRCGFVEYVIGQLQECAKMFSVELDAKVLSIKDTDNGCQIEYRLNFDNSPFLNQQIAPLEDSTFPDIPSTLFFEVFPMSLFFDKDLKIRQVGKNLQFLFGEKPLKGKKMTSIFTLRRPLSVKFTYDDISHYNRVVFELQFCVLSKVPQENSDPVQMILRGQMEKLPSNEMIAFLCVPLIENVEDLEMKGLYLNDLSMTDNSRDMILVGHQHAPNMELALDKIAQKVNETKIVQRKAEEYQQASRDLLYSVIPKTIGRQLENGENPAKTWKIIDGVTLMFCSITRYSRFVDISKANSTRDFMKNICEIFEWLDKIIEEHKIFKVETKENDGLLLLATGLDGELNHPNEAAKCALELIQSCEKYSRKVLGKEISLEIGMDYGSVVSGVVGLKNYQYCLFGDTVNTASRMDYHSLPGRIQLTQQCRKQLCDIDFVICPRGVREIKGKGMMPTYWLAGIRGDETTEENRILYEKEFIQDGMTMEKFKLAELKEEEIIKQQKLKAAATETVS